MQSTTELVTDFTTDIRKNGHKRKFMDLTLSEKAKYVRKLITVEPLLVCYLAAVVIASPAMQNLQLEITCKANKGYNDSTCEGIIGGLENYTIETLEVQYVLTNMGSWQNPIQQIVPMILILFLGSFSDRHKIRKPFLLVPIFGEFFALVGVILCVFFISDWPVEVQGFFQTILPSIFGSYTMISMAAFSYIADVSDSEDRTLRIGIVQIVLNGCVVLVQPISGVLFREIGYIGILIVVGVLFAIAIFYGIFCLKEPKKPEFDGEKNLILDMFDPRHATDTFSLLVMKHEGISRTLVVTALLMNLIYCMINQGEANLLFLFTQTAFSWTVVEFSFYGTVSFVIHLAGVAVAVPLFTKLLSLNDSMILVLSFIDRIISNVFLGFVKTGTMFYVGTAIGIITSVAAVALRSLLTKIVTEDSISRALSLFVIFESLGTAISAPIYNQGIYNPTVKTFPAAIFFFGAALSAVLIVLTVFVRYKENQKTHLQENGAKKSEPNIWNGNGNNSEYVQTTHM